MNMSNQMIRSHAHLRWAVAITGMVVLSHALGCAREARDSVVDVEDQPAEPLVYISADGDTGTESLTQQEPVGNNISPDGTTDLGGSSKDGIYQHSEEKPDVVFHLGGYRGFQVLDLSDAASPTILARLPIHGVPVDMHQAGDRVYVLINERHVDWDDESEPSLQSHKGGWVTVIDVADPHNPVIESRARVDGWGVASHLVRDQDGVALFVMSGPTERKASRVTSFSKGASGELEEKMHLEFGEDVDSHHMRVTSRFLVTSRADFGPGERSELSLIDISSSDGVMSRRHTVLASGYVNGGQSVAVRGDMLWVVSHRDALVPATNNAHNPAPATNHIQTYDISDPDALVLLDDFEFGSEGHIHTAMFLDTVAHVVTSGFEELFTFEITDDGTIQLEARDTIPDWIQRLEPVGQSARLIGIGGVESTPKVALYDATEPSMAPLVSLSLLDSGDWSETRWHARAATVLEDAVSVASPDGAVTETGLILLPFSGWNATEMQYVAGVRALTFSESTITRRGIMNHGSLVNGAFQTGGETGMVANISGSALGLHDKLSLDTPMELGRVEIAPNYPEFMVIGDYGVRRHDRSDYYAWWGSHGQTLEADSLQVVSLGGDVDRAPSLATVEIPARARVHRLDDLLISVSTRHVPDPSGGHVGGVHTTRVDVWDFSIPTLPTLLSTLPDVDLGLNGLQETYGWRHSDCGTGISFAENPHSLVVGDTLVVPSFKAEREVVKTHSRTIHTVAPHLAYNDARCLTHDSSLADEVFKECEFFEGSYECQQVVWADGVEEPEVCEGQISKCTQSASGEKSCEVVTVSEVETVEGSSERTEQREWFSLSLNVIDFSDPTAPSVPNNLAMPGGEEYVSMLARGNHVYVSYKKSTRVEGDPRPHASYWLKRIDLSDPAAPVVSRPISIPGQLVATDGDVAIVQDYVWEGSELETELNVLDWAGDQLIQRGAPYRFGVHALGKVVLGEDGYVYVGYKFESWESSRLTAEERADIPDPEALRLAVLELSHEGLVRSAEVVVDKFAHMKDPVGGEFLFSVDGGMLVMNVSDPATPHVREIIPTLAVIHDIALHGSELFIAAGRHGLYRYNIGDDGMAPRSE